MKSAIGNQKFCLCEQEFLFSLEPGIKWKVAETDLWFILFLAEVEKLFPMVTTVLHIPC